MEGIDFEPNAYKNYVYNFIVNNKDTYKKSFYTYNVPIMFFRYTPNRSLSLTTILRTWRTLVKKSYDHSSNNFRDFLLACIMEQYWDGTILEN